MAFHLRQVSVFLRPDQHELMKKLSLQRSEETGGRPDSSAIIRGILDLYANGQLKAKGAANAQPRDSEAPQRRRTGKARR